MHPVFLCEKNFFKMPKEKFIHIIQTLADAIQEFCKTKIANFSLLLGDI
jgi:hypothetical protein